MADLVECKATLLVSSSTETATNKRSHRHCTHEIDQFYCLYSCSLDVDEYCHHEKK